jgi:hypothetical protein
MQKNNVLGTGSVSEMLCFQVFGTPEDGHSVRKELLLSKLVFG